MTSSATPGRWRRRPALVLAAVATIAATLAVATLLRPVELIDVLLLVLVEVVAVSLVAGRAVAAATAAGAFFAVNALLVPPYGTLVISQKENWLILAIFLLLAVGASSLVDALVESERRAAAAGARETALAEALRPDDPSARSALNVLRSALQLEVAGLVESGSGRLLLTTAAPPPGAPTLVVAAAPGLEVRGWGPEVLGSRPDYVAAMATAAARAWQGEQLAAEQERADRLAEVDAARSALLASIGHDLRTPLAGIRISADALAVTGSTLDDADRATLLQGLRQSAVRLDELLSGVLDAARIDSGAATVRFEQVDLRGILSAAATDYTGDRLEIGTPADPVMVSTDPVIAERIVANLIANALAHTPEGTDVLVSATSRADGSGELSVVDHGAGLVPEAIDVGRNPHGLGLLIVERLAGFAGVAVSTSTTAGGGLTVVLTFPGPT